MRGGARNIGTLFFRIQCVATFGVRSKGGVRVRPVHVVIIAFRGGVRRLAGDHATVAEAQHEDCAATSLGRRRHDLDLCTFQCPSRIAIFFEWVHWFSRVFMWFRELYGPPTARWRRTPRRKTRRTLATPLSCFPVSTAQRRYRIERGENQSSKA